MRAGKTLLDVAKAIYGEPLPEDPSILLQVLDKLKDLNERRDDVFTAAQREAGIKKEFWQLTRIFRRYCVLFKVFSLLQEKFLGVEFPNEPPH